MVLGVHGLDFRSCAVEIYISTLIHVSPSQGSYHQLLLWLDGPQYVYVSDPGVTLTRVQSWLVTGSLWTNDFTFPNPSFFT